MRSIRVFGEATNVDTPKEWTYYHEDSNSWVTPYISRDDLAALYKEGKITKHTECVNTRTARPAEDGLGTRGVPYSSLSFVDVTFDPEPDELLAARSGKPTTVLSGPNNGGKTFF